MTASAIGAWSTGCAVGSRSLEDDARALTNERSTPAAVLSSARRVWEAGDDGAGLDRAAARSRLETLAWDRTLDGAIRYGALELLLLETGPDQTEANRLRARAMLPTEPEPEIVGLLSRAIAAGGWTEATDALVRRLSQPLGALGVSGGDDRPEASAIGRLHPGLSVEEVAFGLFVSPPELPGAAVGLRWPERTRSAAWGLLSARDPSGATRRGLLERPTAQRADAQTTKLLDDLRACARELRTLPRADLEFAWLGSIRDGSAENAAWWAKAAAVVGGLDAARAEGLELRHIEAVRWAAMERADWLGLTREGLLDELERRLRGRERHTRRAEFDAGNRRRARERLADWAAQMSWGDALTVLAVDEAVRSQGVLEAMRTFAARDYLDEGTEYGGVIEWAGAGAGAGGAFRAVLYLPRARDRLNDEAFIASEDMIAASDRALAHFHMQVQARRNSVYAGPSPGDMAYASRSGRTAVVFTSIRDGVLGVDVYDPEGVVIDLGEIGG